MGITVRARNVPNSPKCSGCIMNPISPIAANIAAAIIAILNLLLQIQKPRKINQERNLSVLEVKAGQAIEVRQLGEDGTVK